MLERPVDDTPQEIAFLLLPRFSLIGLLSAIEPLRGANRALGHTAYTWRFLSVDGQPVRASNGMPIATEILGDNGDFPPAVCVVASYEPMQTVTPGLLKWLRGLYRHGSDIGAFETGAFILAAAGILDGRRVSVHWEALEAFRETYLKVEACDSLFEIDAPFFSCSGGITSMDLMLHLITHHHGVDVGNAVADQFVHSEIRAANVRQRMRADRRAGIYNSAVARVIDVMEAHVETPLALNDLAVLAGLGKRQMERLFTHYMNESPYRYYLGVRLERARQLARYSDLPLYQVGLACGFSSAAGFSRMYRSRFGHPPRVERKARVEDSGARDS